MNYFLVFIFLSRERYALIGFIMTACNNVSEDCPVTSVYLHEIDYLSVGS